MRLILVAKSHDFRPFCAILVAGRNSLKIVLALCDFIRNTAVIMKKSLDANRFNTVAEFMRASGLNDAELAKLLDIDRSEATRLRLGRTYRSLIKPLKISKVCKVPIESLAPAKAA